MEISLIDALAYLPSWLMPIVYVVWQLIKYRLLDKKEKKMKKEKEKEKCNNLHATSSQFDCCDCGDCSEELEPNEQNSEEEKRYIALMCAQELALLQSYVAHTNLTGTPVNDRLDTVYRMVNYYIKTGDLLDE